MLFPWYHLLALLTAGLVVFWSIPQIQAIALKHQKFDLPSARKVHQRPMVRFGGMAICAGTLVALVGVWSLGAFSPFAETLSRIAWVLVGGLLFFGIGLADDCQNLSPFTRLLLQFGVASGIWAAGIQIEFVGLPGIGIVHLDWLSLPVTVVWLVGVVNAINWIDGLDGLASGVCCIAAIAIFIVCWFTGQIAVALVMMAIAGSLLGFLYYNFNPAQIFMGDGGSYFIGFMMAGMSIVGLVKGAAITAILVPLLILAVPILDMIAVILVRLQHGQSPFRADKRHLHHRLLRVGLSHRFTVVFIYTLALWVSSLAIALVGIPNGLLLVVGATGLLGCTTWAALRQLRQA